MQLANKNLIRSGHTAPWATTRPRRKRKNNYFRPRYATTEVSKCNLATGTENGGRPVLDDLDKITFTSLPKGVTREFAGQSQEYKESSTGLYYFFLLALVFIFLVLAAQFESFVHPFTILLSVPLAVFGALVSLFVFGQSMNIYSQIGLIMLIGLVTKNAILIVEFANQLRARGREVKDAIVEASLIRLRPILMTSFATIFGILPIAIGLGAGAEARRPLGIAVVGGMLFSTFLTLVLVPVVYSIFAKYTPVHEVEKAIVEEQEADLAASPQHAS
ncbi:efflux RND transporter permease subunit [bacterium]|nr:efflux RND transporter permease subunit [bacterium]